MIFYLEWKLLFCWTGCCIKKQKLPQDKYNIKQYNDIIQCTITVFLVLLLFLMTFLHQITPPTHTHHHHHPNTHTPFWPKLNLCFHLYNNIQYKYILLPFPFYWTLLCSDSVPLQFLSDMLFEFSDECWFHTVSSQVNPIWICKHLGPKGNVEKTKILSWVRCCLVVKAQDW